LKYQLQAMRLLLTPLTAVQHAGEHVDICLLMTQATSLDFLVCTAAKTFLQLVIALLQLAAVELQAMAARTIKAAAFATLTAVWADKGCAANHG